ncbi:hypothetical protein FA13DRAFT_59691 [Coprinellus micaceus]|uniref:Uncharacterized protein n=1 Tax=Coprinellus micaceus TaxID=71717 RepID=A0A4Y7U193_COPMI|nr:hypothetical protein FA13DRAFT_59691 [Coprinellus micaceus]
MHRASMIDNALDSLNGSGYGASGRSQRKVYIAAPSIADASKSRREILIQPPTTSNPPTWDLLSLRAASRPSSCHWSVLSGDRQQIQVGFRRWMWVGRGEGGRHEEVVRRDHG